MALKKRVSQGSIADSLSDRIAAFQEGFGNQSRLSGVGDLASHFVAVVRHIIGIGEIDVLHRDGHSGGWVTLADNGAGGSEVLNKVVKQDSKRTQYDENDKALCVVQKLVDDTSIGIVLRKSRAVSLTALDTASLKLFVLLFGNAFREVSFQKSEKNLIFSLNHRVLQLNSLIDTGIEVSKLDQDASPHQLALERAASLTNASKGVVVVKTGKAVKEELFFPETFSRPGKQQAGGRIETRFTFQGNSYTFELFEKESRSGAALFEETDQLLLDALARQVHASLENRFLLEQALEKQRYEQEMNVAASIQQKIIPKALPEIPGYDLAGINIPSKSVGGDYYDCIPLPNGTYALVIADVAGKGMPAALLVSSLHAYLSAYLESSMTLSELGKRLNTVIGQASTDDKFITGIIAILHPETGEVESLNAGHNPGYILKADNTVQELTVGGLPLGMVDMGLPFESERITLSKGDRLFFYTDGITEAEDGKGGFYEDVKTLRQFAEQHKPPKAASFISDLIADIKKYTGSAPQSDDITALYLHRES